MNRVLKIFLFLIFAALIFSCQKHDFPRLRGSYLGQKLPGMSPELFAPGVISTGLGEGSCAWMPEKNEMIFAVIFRRPHSNRVFSALVTTRVEDGIWTSPEFLKFSEAKYMDCYPFITYDGKELYFQSDRPTNRPDLPNQYNIWRCRREAEGWSDPEPLPLPINGRGDVSGPSMSLSGEFFFTLMTGNPKVDGIYRSQREEGAFSEPQKLPETVNVKEGSFDGVVSPDGNYYIVCVYNKEDSFGETDLYVTFQDEKSGWTRLINLGSGINTKFNEGTASISPDGKYLFFPGFLVDHGFFEESITYSVLLNNSLKPQYGSSDIYWVDAKIVQKTRESL